ncbi:hypothetical protein C8R43DRAFT_274246 [Mycena crocata]|nr:hypothetical protein C8R43DRAFT_274246 [Mycena crocata]
MHVPLVAGALGRGRRGSAGASSQSPVPPLCRVVRKRRIQEARDLCNYLPATLGTFRRSSSIALFSFTPRSRIVDLGAERSLPLRRKQRNTSHTSASSNAITFSSSIPGSISMTKDWPKSVTKVSSMILVFRSKNSWEFEEAASKVALRVIRRSLESASSKRIVKHASHKAGLNCVEGAGRDARTQHKRVKGNFHKRRNSGIDQVIFSRGFIREEIHEVHLGYRQR